MHGTIHIKVKTCAVSAVLFCTLWYASQYGVSYQTLWQQNPMVPTPSIWMSASRQKPEPPFSANANPCIPPIRLLKTILLFSSLLHMSCVQLVLVKFMGPKFPIRHFLFVGLPLLLRFAALNFQLSNSCASLYCLPFTVHHCTACLSARLLDDWLWWLTNQLCTCATNKLCKSVISTLDLMIHYHK